MLLVGEIGIARDTFLYELKWWEIKAIIEGYRRRERTFCLMTRWSTFMTMCTGMADLKKAGISSEKDLMKFPWENDNADTELPSDEDVERMRDELIEMNKKMAGG